jgi:hypothetical protein
MADDQDKPLTQADKELIFKQATTGLVHWYGKQFDSGMTDEELESALKSTLGIFGGSGGSGRPSVSFSGTGLRIWGAWHTVNHVKEKPLFSGKATIAMARQVYRIKDPDNTQMDLF